MKIFIFGLLFGVLITLVLIDEIEGVILKKTLKNINVNKQKKDKKEQDLKEAEYYVEEAKKIIKENDKHIPHLD